MRVRWLLGALGWALVGCGSDAAKSAPSASASGAPSAASSVAAARSAEPLPADHRATFAIRRMADDFPVVSRALKNLPVGGAFFDEDVPLGARRMEVPPDMIAKICTGGLHCDMDGKRAFIQQPVSEVRTFIRIVAQPDETPNRAIQRLGEYLAGFAKPDREAEYAYGELLEIDSETKRVHAVGARNYVVVGPSPVTEKDIESAAAILDKGPATVAITFTADAASRLEKFTTDNTYRRIALVVDGFVVSAPMVTAPITGGAVSLTFGAEEATEADREQARAMAASLKVPSPP